ncbi:MAG: DUF2238 domain-containing protein [Candidatus Sphingomonas colombiensis]|nr:DUF2238 domain-containing protein [Sphingomonas sp.]WEK44723.1 MAG: DUF2238 domain-containing protein [Sphingomonas sp.]
MIGHVPAAQRWMILILAIAVGLANVAQPFPEIAPLQHVPTVALILFSPFLLTRFPLSNGSVLLLTAFFLLHTLAGRYTYSNVPYDDWARSLVGHDISSFFGGTRNDFDRLVHLSFGMLWMKPFAEAMCRYAGLGKKAAIWMAFLFVGAVSAAYEVFEWLLTIVVAPDLANDYNGQQGDPWDAQKDMAIAMLGAAISAGWLWRTSARSSR